MCGRESGSVFVAAVMAVIDIKIQKDSAFSEETESLPVSLILARKRPGEFSGENDIKGLIRKIGPLCVHAENTRG